MAARETMRARQAALLLHGLPPAARQQVIARLGADESSRLQPLLDELAELGLSRSLGRQLLMETSAAPEPGMQASTVEEQAEKLSADDVARCLLLCAPATVAKLLRARAWSWKMQVLDRMTDLRRAKVLQYMRNESPPLAPAVLRTLCERLCVEAAQQPVQRPNAGDLHIDHLEFKPPAARRRTGFRRLIEWMR